MNKVRTSLIFFALIAFSISSCVPHRKYEEMKEKKERCDEERIELTSKFQEMEAEYKEMKIQYAEREKMMTKLVQDTALLGSSLSNMKVQYDKINRLNDEILAKLERLQQQDALENKGLKTDLEITRLELLRKEDSLNKLAAELEEKRKRLETLTAELQKREARVLELEGIIAAQQNALDELKNKIKEALSKFEGKGLVVTQKDGKIYVSMEAKLLFPSGSTDIDPQGKKALVELAKVLQSQIDLDILVEGHTDTDKIKRSTAPRNNWELSVLRATAVVNIMLNNSKMDPKKVTAAGRSYFDPVDPNNKAKNRRIEVILIPDLQELFNLIESPKQN